MDLSQIRRKTRRLAQERVANDWDDTLDVDPAINASMFAAQNRVEYIRPGTFATFAVTNLTANTARYPRPAFHPVVYSRLKTGGDPTIATDYVKCNQLSLDQVTPDASGNAFRIDQPEELTVVEDDDEIIVYPTPTASVTSGLRVHLDPPIPLVANGDIPRLRVELHERIAYGAAARLLDEDPNVDSKFKSYLWGMFNEFFGNDNDALIKLARIYPRNEPTTMLIESPILTDPSGHWRIWQWP